MAGAEPALIDGVGAVSSATARMVACDGAVTEIVVNHHGRPLAVKETATPNRAQRRAALARDTCCIGCGARASRCQLHHIRWRRDNGATVVDNLVLVCWACHHGIHHNNWQVVQDPTGRYRIHRPDGSTPTTGAGAGAGGGGGGGSGGGGSGCGGGGPG